MKKIRIPLPKQASKIQDTDKKKRDAKHSHRESKRNLRKEY